MALCDTCLFMNKEYDDLCQDHDDVIIEGEEQRVKHYCPMYQDNIPEGIYYENADCEYYQRESIWR